MGVLLAVASRWRIDVHHQQAEANLAEDFDKPETLVYVDDQCRFALSGNYLLEGLDLAVNGDAQFFGLVVEVRVSATNVGFQHRSASSGAAAAAAITQLVNQVAKFVGLIRADQFERQASARLLSNELAPRFLARLVLLALGGVVLPMAGYVAIGFAFAVAGELLGRYLFFVSVVPKNMAMTFFGQQQEAA